MNEFAHYLAAKRTVDDRALNRRVLDRLRNELPDRPAIADIGAGIGTGLERLEAWGVVSDPGYTAVDPNAELLASVGRGDRASATLADFAADPSNHARFDLVIAHALLDIVPLDDAVEQLTSLARSGGLLYLPITYDGETIFEPAHDDDASVLESYHRAMDVGGDSRAGRKLLRALERARLEVLEVGSSDWIVRATDGSYPDDETFFLEQILTMFERTVGERADAWVAERRAQVERGELLFIAHQLDYLARK